MNNNTDSESKARKSWYMQNFFKKIDIFGKPLPSFNLKGETKVPTLAGGLVTFMIICVFLTYGCLKFFHLIERANPAFS